MRQYRSPRPSCRRIPFQAVFTVLGVFLWALPVMGDSGAFVLGESTRAAPDSSLSFRGRKLPESLEAFDRIELTVSNPGPLALLEFRAVDSRGNDYWKRHNNSYPLRPGRNTVLIPIGGFFRGERGGGDFLPLAGIEELNFHFPKGEHHFTVESVRLTKGAGLPKVPGLRAFDFGPEASATFPGFVKVAAAYSYTPERGFGWTGTLPDGEEIQEQPDSLTDDFVKLRDTGAFDVDAPDGKYVIALTLDSPPAWDFMYWSHRKVRAGGVTVLKEEQSPEDFLRRSFFRHEAEEDLPGTGVWEKYANKQIERKIFTGESSAGRLRLEFSGDPAGLTPSALVIFPEEMRDAGMKWLDEVDALRKAEFEAQYAETLHAPEKGWQLPDDDRNRGFVLFHRDLETAITFSSRPGGHPSDSRELPIHWTAAPGETLSADLGIFPLRELRRVSLSGGELANSAGRKIGADRYKIGAIRYKLRRIGGRVNEGYEYTPNVITDVDAIRFQPDIARRLWITVDVPHDVAPGDYSGALSADIDGSIHEIPVRLTVLPLRLDAVDFPVGMFRSVSPSGVIGPAGGAALRELSWPENVLEAYRLHDRIREIIRDQKAHGLTAVTVPAPVFSGIAGGKAQIDFSRTDFVMEALRAEGFSKQCLGYSTVFRVGEENWDEKARAKGGESSRQVVTQVFGDIAAHSQNAGWLPVAWAIADEPLIHGIEPGAVIDGFKIHNEAAPGIEFVLEDSLRESRDVEVIPHIDIVSANGPTRRAAASVRKYGKKYWLNNIGVSRAIFGWYLFKARRELGIEGLFQWGYSTNKGDPFYDLDGSEGDSGLSTTTSAGQRSKREWEMIREGIYDYRYLLTLSRLIAEARGSEDPKRKEIAEEAADFTERTFTKIDVERPREISLSNGELNALKEKLARYIGELS